MAIRKDYDHAEEFFKKAIKIEPNNGSTLASYGLFLMAIRKDYDRAEEFFKKATKIEPNNGSALANYGLLLMNIRKDYDQAEQFCQKAIAADPMNSNYLVSYAKILIVQGNFDKAKLLINRAFKDNQDNKDLELELELWFYCYAVFYLEYPKSDANIESLLAKGVKSPICQLKDILEVARKRGHPDYERLSQFENRIAGT